MRYLFVVLVVWLTPFLAQAQTSAIILTPVQEQRAETIAAQLRCLVCQNESIQDSSAALAVQLRQIIRQKIAKGASTQQIKDYMVQRYGIFILLQPPFSPLTWLLYASPFLALFAGGGIFYLSRRQHTDPKPALSKAEQTRLDELLK